MSNDPTPTPAPASAVEALALLRSAMGYLAAADPTAMAVESQAEALRELERLDAVETAARAAILGAFTAVKGYAADAAYSPRSWLMHQTKVTRGAAGGHVAWVRRVAAHPHVMAALAAGQVTESYARAICGWTDGLPGACQQDGDVILLGAVNTGADLAGLSDLAADLYSHSLPRSAEDEDADFDDRSVKVATTFEGAGVIHGNLTPQCASLVSTVLESLSAPVDADDTRTHDQRFHDGLQEAMRRLVAAGLLPQRAGQPTRASVHVSLAELRAMDAASALEQEWVAHVRGRWAAARARASVTGGDGSAWLDGQAARAVTCDAALIPVVTAEVDTGVLDDLVRLCLELSGHGHCGHQACDQDPDPSPDPEDPDPEDPDPSPDPGQGCEPGSAACLCPARPPLTPRARQALEQAIIGRAADLMSGPGGLASYLRTRLLDARLAGPSLPLDVGISRDIPGAIRHAVIVRAQGHCEWPGGCHQPAAACEVHHVRHRADGGQTSVRQCALLCFFHHQVCVHRWGWTLVLNPDGTTTAWDPDRTRVLRSHGPPTARAG